MIQLTPGISQAASQGQPGWAGVSRTQNRELLYLLLACFSIMLAAAHPDSVTLNFSLAFLSLT